jgi:hypothetical protein
VIVGRVGLASADTVPLRPTLERAGVVWHVEFTQTCTGTFATGTGPTLPDTVWGAAHANPETASDALTIPLATRSFFTLQPFV